MFWLYPCNTTELFRYPCQIFLMRKGRQRKIDNIITFFYERNIDTIAGEDPCLCSRICFKATPYLPISHPLIPIHPLSWCKSYHVSFWKSKVKKNRTTITLKLPLSCQNGCGDLIDACNLTQTFVNDRQFREISTMQ